MILLVTYYVTAYFNELINYNLVQFFEPILRQYILRRFCLDKRAFSSNTRQ